MKRNPRLSTCLCSIDIPSGKKRLKYRVENVIQQTDLLSLFFFFFSQIIIIQLRDTLLLYIRRLLFRVIKRH